MDKGQDGFLIELYEDTSKALDLLDDDSKNREASKKVVDGWIHPPVQRTALKVEPQSQGHSFLIECSFP